MQHLMGSARGVDAGASPPPGSLLLPHRFVDSFSLETLRVAHGSDGPDEGPSFETLDRGEEGDAAGLAVLKLLEVELNLEASEKQGESDTDSEEEADDVGDGELVDLLETRLRNDGLGAEEARRIAEQVVQIRTQREEWKSIHANLEAADIAYDEILSEFAARRREIEASGVEVRMGPMPCVSMSPCIYRGLRLTSLTGQADRGTLSPCSSSTFSTGRTTRSRKSSDTSTPRS